MQLPFYIASSKAPHRVSRVAEKQLVRDLAIAMLICRRMTAMACQYHIHASQAVVHVVDAQPQM